MSEKVTRQPQPSSTPEAGPPSLVRRVVASKGNVWWQGVLFGFVVGFGLGAAIVLLILVSMRTVYN